MDHNTPQISTPRNILNKNEAYLKKKKMKRKKRIRKGGSKGARRGKEKE